MANRLPEIGSFSGIAKLVDVGIGLVGGTAMGHGIPDGPQGAVAW